MLSRRVVVMMEPTEHDALRRLAAGAGTSVAEVVRNAVRAHLLLQQVEVPAERASAAAFLCAEHDPDFDWLATKAALQGRHDLD